MSQRFIQLLSGHLVDLSQVESVGPVRGDPAHRRFAVRFRSGCEVDIYEPATRNPYAECMGRQEFVDLLLDESWGSHQPRRPRPTVSANA